MRSKLTVLIPCKDERAHLRDCVESVRPIADEILVADSGSTDGSLDIACELGCRIIEREYINSANFKNWAIPQATYEWVLVVDSDERVSPDLAEEIHHVLAEPACDGYSVRRDFTFLGNVLRDCGMTSNRLLRLFRRDVGRYQERRVHADVQIPSGKVGRLQAPLMHHMVIDLDHFLARKLRYSSWSALDRWDKGQRATFFKMLFHTPIRFLQLYFLRRGFLDGRAGFVFCGIMAFYTFLKDAKLWVLETTDSSRDKMEEAARRHTLTYQVAERPKPPGLRVIVPDNVVHKRAA
ncbi:MAG: glycosyltransferase [Planctomycetales bacterium]|nr:glycosyltransferase [Planctomycetales bacterium]